MEIYLEVPTAAFLFSLLLAVPALLLYYHYGRRELVQVGFVSAIYVYPIKSCAGLSLIESHCTKSGLEWHGMRDRHWVVMDTATGKCIGQRHQSRLTFIHVRESDCNKYMELRNASTEGPQHVVQVPLCPPRESRMCQVKLFDLTGLPGLDCGDEAARWISQVISPGDKETDVPRYRLVTTDEKRNWRKDTSTFGLEPLLSGKSNNNPVAFPNLTSYMMSSETSLKDLNNRITATKRTDTSKEIIENGDNCNDIDMRQLRPNIVVSGVNGAFEESSWDRIEIGNDNGKRVVFHFLKDCDRCSLTTINPDTGERRADGEPLTTLRKYRLYSGEDEKWKKAFGNSPLFGINISIYREGDIKVGDKVWATKRKH